MISAAGIPVIDGDMDALAGHASELMTLGDAVATTGADVHHTWQNLAAVYRAPEAGDLLAATAPVQLASAGIGDDLAAAGTALNRYAEQVRAIQARLDELRAQATTLEAEAAVAVTLEDADASAALNQRSDELVAAVNAAVAEFEAAQRDCANALTALYGGTRLVADNGDGVLAHGEFGSTAAHLDQAATAGAVPWSTAERLPEDYGGWGLSDLGHGLLDVAGLVPVLGEAADGVNALWYTAEGDYTNAALSAGAMVPFLGWGATGTKFGLKAADAAMTSRAARREGLRQAGIPRSQQPIGQSRSQAGYQYVYEVPASDGGTRRVAVTQQTTDRVPGHGPHWEVGTVKPPEIYGRDPLGRLRVFNQGKTKVDYE